MSGAGSRWREISVLEACSSGPEQHCSGGAQRRGGPSQAKAAPERSGAAGRSAGSRGAPITAAVQGAEPRSRRALSAVLSVAALSAAVRGAEGAARPCPRLSPSREGWLASLTNSPQVPGYFIGQPHRPTPRGVQNKHHSESWKNVQRQRARSLRVGDDRFLQVRLGFAGGVCAHRAGLPCPSWDWGTDPARSRP